ncbi:hypothetical protein B0I37DRAFT_125683 [Chaetomium sp. MPI-CAGE-AT-0009]|nr:hypothetical protein B0I37DRAFT_125683 [Chaetomium sp. MPI-CAGE-AT-0009]
MFRMACKRGSRVPGRVPDAPPLHSTTLGCVAVATLPRRARSAVRKGRRGSRTGEVTFSPLGRDRIVGGLFWVSFFYLFGLLFYLHIQVRGFIVDVGVAIFFLIAPFDGPTLWPRASSRSRPCFAGTVTLLAILSTHLPSLTHLGQVTALRLPASSISTPNIRIWMPCIVILTYTVRPFTLKRRDRSVIQGLPAPFHFGV